MFQSFIIQFFRNIKRRKLFSFINITGLGFGIAFILLIGQYLYHEFNCNKEIKDIEQIYRLVDAGNKDYNIDYRISDKILETIPDVKNACIFNHFGTDANYKNQKFYNRRWRYQSTPISLISLILNSFMVIQKKHFTQ